MVYARILRGNSDNATARKSKQSVTRQNSSYLFQLLFRKKEKKSKRSENDASNEEEKNKTTLTRMILYHHLRTFRFTSFYKLVYDHFFYHIHVIIIIIIVVSIIILSRSLSLSLSLSLFDYYAACFTRASLGLSRRARRLYSCSCGPSPRFPFLKTQTR